jgi:hypothetical protein
MASTLKKILLNKNIFSFSITDLPCLIHGKEKMGSSLFTMSLCADLFTQGYKLLCITGYPMAKEEFLSQTGAEDETTSISNVINQKTELNKKAIFVTKENPLAFIQLTKMMSDINERVILLKNIDLLNKDVFETVKNHQQLIVSGDFDNCNFSDEILKIHCNSKVFFSPPSKNFEGIYLPSLEHYHGYFKSQHSDGDIYIKV